MMINRGSARGAALVAAIAMLATGCAGLYSGRPEKLRRPKTEKMPQDAPVGPAEIKWVTECKAQFQEEPAGALAKHRRNAGRTTPLVAQGRALLDDAASAATDEQRAGAVKEAINKLRKVFDEAPYSADATYYLAVAYARARRKECSKLLLKRLAALAQYPEFQANADRMILQAQDDATLRLFEKEMLEALGK